MEVETPLLCQAGGTDPNLHPFVTRFRRPGQAEGVPLYLQTSPEFAMKRLLAAGSGSIYQICKAFRNEEAGRYHNPEFTILEWYRPGFNLEQLMDEIDTLFVRLLAPHRDLQPSERVTYRDAFRKHAEVDPLTASLGELAACAGRHGLAEAEMLCGADRPVWLDFLFSHLVQPFLGQGRLSFVFDYPACQSSLARKKPNNPLVVERVEAFLDGIELANGFRELADPAEQEQRFDADLLTRRSQGQFLPAKDQRLLAALQAGLPDCSGVALGLDRLLMRLTGAKAIDEVLAFPVERA